MDIVDKILSEEKALATRKKQQPHLFVDRQRELVKVVTNHFSLERVDICLTIHMCDIS